MVIAIAIAELVRMLVNRQVLKRATGLIILSLLIFIAVAALIKTGLDFSTWAYSHTGHRFKYGAYLLPLMLVLIFVHAIIKLPKIMELPIVPVTEKVKVHQPTSDVDNKS